MSGILTSLTCSICGSSTGHPVYEGRIRAGRFGTLTKEDYRVIRCASCGVDRLDPFPSDSSDYETGVYRQLVDGSSEVSQYYLNHDQEIADRLKLIGSAALRNRVVMDVGCGAGAFLDSVKGLAGRTIGIEPQHNFGAALKEKGHQHYSYASELASTAAGSVDVAVSFQVIEHVAEPKAFLTDITRCLTRGGRLHLTTPNRDDILMLVGPGAYRQFFYRLAHTWYFDMASLRRTAESAGLTVVQISTPHNYDLSNFAIWLRDQRPCGLGAVPELAGPADAAFRAQVVATGRGDAIYAVLERPA
jgi:2-polyprenyl-3-methyl-5-hydroxy-6-metoxy-1,4-benzoquinol methylase